MTYYLYKRSSDLGCDSEVAPPLGYTYMIWRPGLTRMIPEGMSDYGILLILWWVMWLLRIFKNSDYAVCLLYHEDKVIHYSVVLPPFFKVPFLGKNDLQIGPVGTSYEHRRKGLAYAAIMKIINEFGENDRNFWYITRLENLPSKKTCEKAGFDRFAVAEKTSGRGLKMLSRYQIIEKL